MFSCSTTFSPQGLKFTPWCLDYWVDPSDTDQSVLTIGDIGGQVRDSWRKTKEEREEESVFYSLGPSFRVVCVCYSRSVHYISLQRISACLRGTE